MGGEGQAMTPRQEAFAAGVAQGLSQSEAYRRAYPASLKWADKTVWARASELAADRMVSGRVAELSKKAASANEVTVERVVGELARLAFFDVRKLVSGDGRPIPLHELDEDSARAIVGLDVATVGNAQQGVGEVLKFKLADKGAALERLGKFLKMFTDRVEVDGNLTVVVRRLSEECKR